VKTRKVNRPLPEILILTNEQDFGADEVVRRIDRQRVAVRRLNIEHATRHPIEANPVLDGDAYPNLRAVWWRQFVPGHATPTSTAADDLLVERAQWSAFLALFDRPDVAWVNPLWAARRAENKLVQLRTAAATGFDVPPTILTNDSEQAARFRKEFDACVVKSLTAAYFEHSDQSFVFTEFLTDDLLDEPTSWYRQPVIVQEFLPRASDLRVVAVGDRCFAAEAATSGSDWRKDPGSVNWSPWACEPDLQTRCLRYMAALGLRYVSFDFAVANGRTWFLEANQAGEWLFLDRPLGLGIADVLATYLANLATSAPV
jgi:glutathione synthase/RimK-type ligase-like ATP-grasp enzyme